MKETKRQIIEDDGTFPNNAALPLVVAREVVSPDAGAAVFEELFHRNYWRAAWRSGIFDFDHYHSTAHEVLGCFSGHAVLRLGGAVNQRVELKAGDAMIIPAGVAHRCVSAQDFICVGAYPNGQVWDTCYGKAGERPAADERIAALGPWENDPLASPGV